jgi:hypothetical protein
MTGNDETCSLHVKHLLVSSLPDTGGERVGGGTEVAETFRVMCVRVKPRL